MKSNQISLGTAEGRLLMTRGEALQHFQENYVKAVSHEKRLALEDYYQKNSEELATGFYDSLRQICLRIKAMQTDGAKEKIKYIHYAMLRTAVLDQTYRWRIDAYDSKWYRDEQECSAEYDASWAFRFLAEFEKELEEPRKRYLNQVTKLDLHQIFLKEAVIAKYYVTDLARYALSQAQLPREFSDFTRDTVLEVRSGEYFDISEVVYKEDTTIKDPQEIKDWLEAKKEHEYSYEVLSSLDLSGGDYEANDLRYCDLRGSNLFGSNLRSARLLGAKCAGANFQSSNCSWADIRAVDFSDCNLRKVDFYGASGTAGLDLEGNYLHPGFNGVNFRGADLEGADLRESDFQGAIFTEANLQDVNFGGANLQGAVFSVKDRKLLDLNDEQIQVVIWQ
jgi:uncharacterized protein YjbI with pentapeptide repeats